MRWASIFGVCGAVVGALAVWAFGVRGFVALPFVAVLLAAVGLYSAREAQRRIDARGQEIRVRALERSLELREAKEQGATGNLEGTVVAGQYRLGRHMGSGASGAIYEAKRMSDGTPVAVKLLRAAAAHDTVASDRLRREAEALGLAWHPNVVELLDHGHLQDGTSYMVMELLRGESLAEHLRRRGRFSPEELLPIALQVLRAVVAIHAAGVVHRDIKPSNLFLVPEPAERSGRRVKVLDFGIARVEWEEMRITGTGAPLGTPTYMAPEQEQGQDVDGKCDVFAVGAVLYECLVGEPPSKDPSLRYRAEVQGERGDSGVHRAHPNVPVEWRNAIEKALTVDPIARIDARSLLGELRQLDPMADGPLVSEREPTGGAKESGG
jgi:serine/threonine-protein kinase